MYASFLLSLDHEHRANHLGGHRYVEHERLYFFWSDQIGGPSREVFEVVKSLLCLYRPLEMVDLFHIN